MSNGIPCTVEHGPSKIIHFDIDETTVRRLWMVVEKKDWGFDTVMVADQDANTAVLRWRERAARITRVDKYIIPDVIIEEINNDAHALFANGAKRVHVALSNIVLDWSSIPVTRTELDSDETDEVDAEGYIRRNNVYRHYIIDAERDVSRKTFMIGVTSDDGKRITTTVHGDIPTGSPLVVRSTHVNTTTTIVLDSEDIGFLVQFSNEHKEHAWYLSVEIDELAGVAVVRYSSAITPGFESGIAPDYACDFQSISYSRSIIRQADA